MDDSPRTEERAQHEARGYGTRRWLKVLGDDRGARNRHTAQQNLESPFKSQRRRQMEGQGHSVQERAGRAGRREGQKQQIDAGLAKPRARNAVCRTP